AVNRNTFMRGARAHGIHFIRLGRESSETPQTEFRLADSPRLVVLPDFFVSERKHHFPCSRRTVPRVFGQQFMEEGRAAARHAHNKNGFPDWLAIDGF